MIIVGVVQVHWICMTVSTVLRVWHCREWWKGPIPIEVLASTDTVWLLLRCKSARDGVTDGQEGCHDGLRSKVQFYEGACRIQYWGSLCRTFLTHHRKYLWPSSIGSSDKYQMKMTIQTTCLHWQNNSKWNNGEVGANNATKAVKTITIKASNKQCQWVSRRELTDESSKLGCAIPLSMRSSLRVRD